MKKLNIKNILVPIDFSPMSIRAISAAEYLAQRFQANVHFVHVQEPIYPASFLAPGAPVPVSSFETTEELRKAAAHRIRLLAQERAIQGRADAVIGAPVFDELCRIAREIPADLIVTSTHGFTGLKHVFLGSTTERLVQHAPCPVLVARETKTKTKSAKPGIEQILVPVDFSDCSLAGLNYAVQVADKFAAKIVILHVVNLGAVMTADGYAMYDFSLYEKSARAGAESEMRRFVRQVKFGGVKFETVIECAFSADAIWSVARDKHVDLIVTSTHGRTGLKHVLIGSTAEVVVRHAPCPVLVVPSHAQERAKNLTSRARRSRKHPGAGTLRSALKTNVADPRRPTKNFKVTPHPFPERRKTNKFRESHSSSAV